MNFSLAAFYEPRGVMRILQFIFAICALATTVNFDINFSVSCTNGKEPVTTSVVIDYPFQFNEQICVDKDAPTKSVTISADVSSDAQFFVATGALSIMYCLFIIAVYGLLSDLYQSKNEVPLADFMLTTVLAIFWLSGSAAWSNGTNALKNITDVQQLATKCNCEILPISFSRLNISLILGYLNFFLWASDLWFIYKETIWFHGKTAAQSQGTMGGGPGSISPNV